MGKLIHDTSTLGGGFMAAVFAGLVCVSTVSVAQAGGGADTKIKCEANGQNCKVSKDIYIGWRTFNGNCARCHGETATGSTFAPSLYERMEGMAEPAFKAIVMGGMKGQMGVMPAFGNDGNVSPYLDELWAYLSALTTEKIPPGRPDQLEEGNEVPEYLRKK